MDIIGIVFCALALICTLSGLIRGFVKSLFGLILVIVAPIGAALLTPPISKLGFVGKIIHETPIAIGETNIYAIRYLVVFIALFIIFIIVINLLKGVFNWIFQRVKLLKVFDKALGAIVGLAIIWAIGGALFGLASTGTAWLSAFDEQLAKNNINVNLSSIFQSAFGYFSESNILNAVYSSFNPLGDLVQTLLAV